MKPHSQLITTPEYWMANIQNQVYAILDDYMQAYNLTPAQLAAELNVNQRFLNTVLAGNFNHRLDRLVHLALAVGQVPDLMLKTPQEYEADLSRRMLHENSNLSTELNSEASDR